MRKYLFILLFIGVLGYSAFGQCPTMPIGFVCITQNQADRIAHDLDELKASRDAIAKYAAQAILTDAERAAAKATIQAANDVIASAANSQAISEKIIALQQKVIEMYAALVEKLTAQINKPKSGFAKLMDAIEKIALVALGISVGRL